MEIDKIVCVIKKLQNTFRDRANVEHILSSQDRGNSQFQELDDMSFILDVKSSESKEFFLCFEFFSRLNMPIFQQITDKLPHCSEELIDYSFIMWKSPREDFSIYLLIRFFGYRRKKIGICYGDIIVHKMIETGVSKVSCKNQRMSLLHLQLF